VHTFHCTHSSPKLESLATLCSAISVLNSHCAEVARNSVEAWTGTTLVHVVVVMEGAAGRVGRRHSVHVVLWVGIPGRVFVNEVRPEEAPIPWDCAKARYVAIRVLECAFAHSHQAVSNDQKSAVDRTMILVRPRGAYWGLFSEMGANLSSSQVASRPSVMVQQRT